MRDDSNLDDLDTILRRHAAAQAVADCLRRIEDPGFCSHFDLATLIVEFCDACAAAGAPLAAEDIAQGGHGSRLAAEIVRLAIVPGNAPAVKRLLDAATASDRLWDEMWRALLDLFRRRVPGEAAAKLEGEKAEGTVAGGDPAEGEQAEGIDAQTRQATIAELPPAVRKAYLSYQAALLMAEKREMQDWEAYELLKEQGIPEDNQGELTDYRLPTEDTWRRQIRKARQALGEQKNAPRGGRQHGGSIVRQNQIE